MAKRISAEKFDGSVGSDDPGRKCRTLPMGVQVMSNVALEYSVPGPKKNVLSIVPTSVRWRRAGPSSLKDNA